MFSEIPTAQQPKLRQIGLQHVFRYLWFHLSTIAIPSHTSTRFTSYSDIAPFLSAEYYSTYSLVVPHKSLAIIGNVKFIY